MEYKPWGRNILRANCTDTHETSRICGDTHGLNSNYKYTHVAKKFIAMKLKPAIKSLSTIQLYGNASLERLRTRTPRVARVLASTAAKNTFCAVTAFIRSANPPFLWPSGCTTSDRRKKSIV